MCALLDMKSSKIEIYVHTIDIDDVNKAFGEMHDEIDSRV